MARESLPYDKMVENALRGVVRQALASVASQGLPGNHHFYLTFRTTHPGVEIADRLHAQYPQDMTIVLQHQFWGLEVADDHFVVHLMFSEIPERLKVPYGALVSFVDPSVKFGLQFQAADGATPPLPGDAISGKATASPAPAPKEPPALALAKSSDHAKKDTKPELATAREPAAKPGPDDSATDKKDPVKVISLDAFRKK